MGLGERWDALCPVFRWLVRELLGWHWGQGHLTASGPLTEVCSPRCLYGALEFYQLDDRLTGTKQASERGVWPCWGQPQTPTRNICSPLEAASGLGVSRPLSIRITQNISGKHSFPSISCGAGALNSWGHCTDPWEIESAEGIWGVTPECPAEVPTPFLLPHHLQLQTWI